MKLVFQCSGIFGDAHSENNKVGQLGVSDGEISFPESRRSRKVKPTGQST